jgi:hypothetical protein
VTRSSLIDFLNHGSLPFVGREEERDRILHFWREGLEAHAARAMLLVGEGGVGKSRLLEETIGRVIAEGGAAVHLKLYPDSAAALAPLLARSIRDSCAGSHLLKHEPDGTIASTAAALRRMARLRPTLIAIEDIHLLAGEPLRELATLIDLIADDPLSILFAARPLPLPVRGVLERLIVEEIVLEGIDHRAIEMLWRELFGQMPDDDLIASLARSTRGNALALRSALRGALATGALLADELSGRWRATLPLPAFNAILERHVRFLTEGITAHLSADERCAAERLAWLGEIFARETACAALGDAGMIDALSFKGVITTSPTARPPLIGTASASPLLAFTHTLLHRQLAPAHRGDTEGLIALIDGDLPLYSVLPFQGVAAARATIAASSHYMCEAIERTIVAATLLERTPDWMLGREHLATVEAMIDANAATLEPLLALRLRAAYLASLLDFVARDVSSPEHEALGTRLMELTADPPNLAIARARLVALRNRLWWILRQGRGDMANEWEEFDAIITRFPELRGAPDALDYLASAAKLAPTGPFPEVTQAVERRLEEITLLCDEATCEMAMRRVAANLIWLFESSEELAGRLALADRLIEKMGSDALDPLLWKMMVLEKIGALDDAVACSRRAAERFRERGQTHIQLTCCMVPLWAEAARGADLDSIAGRAAALCAKAPERIAARLRRNAGIRMVDIALLRGDAGFMRRAAASFLQSSTTWYGADALAAFIDGDIEKGLAWLATAPDDIAMLAERMRAMHEGMRPEPLDRASLPTLGEPMLQMPGVIILQLALELVRIYHERAGIEPSPDMRARCRDALAGMLAWLADRELPRYMAPIIERHGALLDEAEHASWRARIDALLMRGARIRQDEPARLAITMLGTIGARRGDVAIPLRGARLRSMLGLLVAAEMLRRPLSYHEFRQLASGGEEEPERARKGMNLAVHRLREALGRDLIITDGEIPRLNLELAEVDLITAARSIDESLQASREGSLARAHRSLARALDIARGEVPFPGLYDRFFEAGRDDFEVMLHRAVVELARGLLREEDAADAVPLLRRGLEVMPNDGEIAELLERALLLLGDHIEAERVRMGIVR